MPYNMSVESEGVGFLIVIGITGGSGSGKSVCTDFFRGKGAAVFDADARYHQMTNHPSVCTAAIARHFGKVVLQADGALDRKKLSELVMGTSKTTEEKRRALNRISHAYLSDACLEQLRAWKSIGVTMAVVDAPLLFEADWQKFCDVTIAVLAPEALRLARIMERDGIPREQAETRLLSQPPDSFYRDRADFVVQNDGSRDKVFSALTLFLNHLSEISEARK